MNAATITSMIPSLTGNTTLQAVIMIAVSLLLCFLGYRITKLAVAIVGFSAGLSFGSFIGSKIGAGQAVTLILMLVIGIALALISFLLYKVGIFLMIFFLIFGIGAVIMAIVGAEGYAWLILLAAAILVGILGVVLIRPVVILTSGISGGLTAISGLVLLTGWNQEKTALIVLIAGLVLGIIGVIVQFKTTKERARDRHRR